MKRVERFDSGATGTMFRVTTHSEPYESNMAVYEDHYRLVCCCPACHSLISFPLYGVSFSDCQCGVTAEFGGEAVAFTLRSDSPLGQSVTRRGSPMQHSVAVPVHEWWVL